MNTVYGITLRRAAILRSELRDLGLVSSKACIQSTPLRGLYRKNFQVNGVCERKAILMRRTMGVGGGASMFLIKAEEDYRVVLNQLDIWLL
jgi:hypothetical protein